MPYTLMTDSSCDLSRDFLKELNVEVIPLEFIIDNVSYLDGEPGAPKPQELYDAIRAGKRTSTSQITQERYLQLMGNLAEKGDIVYLCFSSALSGSYSQSILAKDILKKRYPDKTIHIIDTLTASRGQGLLAWYAAQKRDEGLTAEELKDWIIENMRRVCHLVTVDDLRQLRKGGRISATSEFIGSLLNIKPMIYLNQEGKLVPTGKQRGRKRALNRLIEWTKEDIVNPKEQTLMICHGDCLEDAEYVRRRLIDELGVKDVLIDYCGAVIGSHTGPGVLAVFFFGKNRN